MRAVVLASVVLLLSLAPGVSAATWDNGGGDNLWSNATNWNPNVLPTISDSVSIAMASGPITNTPTAADGNQIRVGMSGGTASTGPVCLSCGRQKVRRPSVRNSAGRWSGNKGFLLFFYWFFTVFS